MARPVAVDPHDRRRSPPQCRTSPSHQLKRTLGEKQRSRSYKRPGQRVHAASLAHTMSGALAPGRDPARLPIGYALTGAKADERQVLLDLLHDDPTLAASRPGQILLADKNYFGRDFEASIAERGIQLLRRARKGEPERPGGRFFKPLRQTVESIFDTLKGQLDLEQHGGHTPQGVLVRVLQRLLAMTTAIWHNDHTGQPVRRSLLAYDH